jgi:hypothetical protein
MCNPSAKWQIASTLPYVTAFFLEWNNIQRSDSLAGGPDTEILTKS